MWFSDIEKMIAACPRVGTTPILRIPDALEANVQKAMDLGVLGIIVPTVDDAIEAREAARYGRFPPTARRSSGGGQTGGLWTPLVPPGSTFRNTINDNMLIIVMIENARGREQRPRDRVAARRGRGHSGQQRSQFLFGIRAD
jgi:4-hydroxy-2-oxoheptanedioate aldolase